MKIDASPLRMKNLISFIWKFLRLQPWKFFLIFFLSLIWSIDSTVWPYLLRLIIYCGALTLHETDRLNAWASLKWLFVAAICLWTTVEVCFRSRDFLRAHAFPKLEADIRLAMFDHIQHHSPKYFNEHFAGSLSNKISDMTSEVSSMLHSLMIFLPAIASSILVLVFFSQVNPLFAMILGIWIVIHFTTCFLFSTKCMEYSKIHGEVRSSLTGKIVDSLTNNFAVNLFSLWRKAIV